MSLTVSLYLVGCVICVSCGIQDTARSWLMVVVRDYIIRPWRHLLGKFNSAALQKRNQLRNRWKLLTVFRHKWLILNRQACLLFTIAHTLAPVAETMLPNLYRWTYFYNHALYHYVTHPTCLLIQFLNSWLGISCPMSCFIAETGVECRNCGVTCCGLFLNPNVGAMSVLSRLGSQNVPVSCLEMLICFD